MYRVFRCSSWDLVKQQNSMCHGRWIGKSDVNWNVALYVIQCVKNLHID